MRAAKETLSATDLEQNKALLDDNEHDADSTAEYCSQKKERPWYRRRPLVLLCLTAALCIACAVFTGVWLHASPKQQASPPASQLAIELHPREHALRKQTTLNFQWNITSGYISPDGTRKRGYLVNGQFPGPLIEARSGDRIIVHVTNNLGKEGISIHWHGLQMRGFNAMDGAVGVTQCPIAPGRDFTYHFQIGEEEYGTFWWHSHSQFQRADGLYGGLVVHKPASEKSLPKESEALLLVGDWFHAPQNEVFDHYDTPTSYGKEPVPDGILINGQGQHHCRPDDNEPCIDGEAEGMLPILRTAEKTRLRIVNTGTVAGLSFAMSNATLEAVAVDAGCPIETAPAKSLGILYPGERVDAVVDWSSEDSTQISHLHIQVDDDNFPQRAILNLSYAFAALPHTLNTSSSASDPFHTESDRHLNLANINSSTIESNFLDTDEVETVLFFVKTQFLGLYHNRPKGFINSTFWKPQDTPLLALNRSSWDEFQNFPFISTSRKPKRVNLIINNHDDGAHSFHLHGNSFFLLSAFKAVDRYDIPGTYNPYHPEEGPQRGWTNYKNPVRKDTVVVPSLGYVLVTFPVDNPGLWLLHCHMMVHQAGGMAAGFHIGSEEDSDHILAQDPAALGLCPASKKLL